MVILVFQAAAFELLLLQNGNLKRLKMLQISWAKSENTFSNAQNSTKTEIKPTMIMYVCSFLLPF